MDRFEYKVVPAPLKGRKARGVRRSEDKFAYSVQEVMNDMALDGWEYQRSETLPHEERSGLTSTSRTFRSVLVFRRQLAGSVSSAPVEEPAVTEIAAPVEITPASEPENPDPVAVRPKRVRPVAVPVVDVDEDDGFFAASPNPAPKPGLNTLPVALRQRATQQRAKDDIAAE
ncbi:MAG: DUF4177 domain-containing protein [Cognatishimia sp.]|uniref:DUF4177 domain-containing protein n=1 Tax=Cognatishimia sp. TaxID=2211648 RepID=UPI003B8CD883